MLKFFQKMGKSLMLPIAVLPICAIFMGIGYLLAPGAMGMEGAETSSAAYYIGFFLVKAGSALIDNIAILFAIGVAIGMSKKADGVSALAGLISWLVVQTLLDVKVSGVLLELDEISTIAFGKINNPFIGILCGFIAAFCYNKFSGIRLPEFLAFFSGKRFVAIATVGFSTIAAAILTFIWPMLFNALVMIGNSILNLGGVGVGIYAFLNRLLIPTGLHHALNNIFWFDTIGIGDLTNYWAGKTSADCTWSLGMYMSGFFPCMMFGIPGACLAMIMAIDKNKRRRAIGVFGSLALCALISGVSEPFEFTFMFLAFPLYVVYALLYAIFSVIVYFVGFRAGFTFSAGSIDLLFSSALPGAQNTWMIIPLGIAAFAVFFLVFYVAIKKLNVRKISDGLKETVNVSEIDLSKAATLINPMSGKDTDVKEDKETIKARKIIEALGGKDNITSVDHCATRLRLELKDDSKVKDDEVKAAGAVGVIKPGKGACQVIIGPSVQFTYDAMSELLG